jgi:hypothetical protein
MIGKVLLTFSVLLQSIGPYVFDYNYTHVFNPTWMPHAKFHNGQTMFMGVCLGMATLYYTHRLTPVGVPAADSILTAVIFGSIYWVTAFSALLYPDSKAADPEFGEGFPQLKPSSARLITAWRGISSGLCERAGWMSRLRLRFVF